MRIKILMAILLFLTGITAGLFSSAVMASNQQFAADAMRQAAMARAKSNLVHETLPEEEYPPQQTDYEALSAQIQRLSRLIEDMAAEQATTHNSILFHGVASGPAQRQKLFGRQGPTVASVTALMQYRLVLVNNPNLKLGAVHDHVEKISALLVTTNGSVVERYIVDKNTGLITSQP